MRDEIDSRIWTDRHQDFSRDLASLFTTVGTTVGTALGRLNEIQFEAPWKRDAPGPGQA